jgi:hypothetical protein
MGPYPAVLKPVIHDHRLDFRMDSLQLFDPLQTILADRQGDEGQFGVQHMGFIAQYVRAVGGTRQMKTAALPSVSPGQDGDRTKDLIEISRNEFGMRGFARASCIDISDTNQGEVRDMGFQPTPIIGQVSQKSNEPVHLG